MSNLRGPERARYVAGMFSRISRRYDRLNTIMTAGRHYAWRRLAVEMAVSGLQGPALDVATGTGDFAIEIAARPEISRVVGLDFAGGVLPLAAAKSAGAGIDYVAGDAHSLPFPDEVFVCVTVGFGVRNFINVPRALSEMARVLRPGGRLVVLEIVRMEGRGPLPRLLPACFRLVTPCLGALFAGDREAYTYLPESVQGFMTAGEISDAIRGAGLSVLRLRSLALGAVAVHVGVKAV